jgi:hypothetical protein
MARREKATVKEGGKAWFMDLHNGPLNDPIHVEVVRSHTSQEFVYKGEQGERIAPKVFFFATKKEAKAAAIELATSDVVGPGGIHSSPQIDPETAEKIMREGVPGKIVHYPPPRHPFPFSVDRIKTIRFKERTVFVGGGAKNAGYLERVETPDGKRKWKDVDSVTPAGAGFLIRSKTGEVWLPLAMVGSVVLYPEE